MDGGGCCWAWVDDEEGKKDMSDPVGANIDGTDGPASLDPDPVVGWVKLKASMFQESRGSLASICPSSSLRMGSERSDCCAACIRLLPAMGRSLADPGDGAGSPPALANIPANMLSEPG